MRATPQQAPFYDAENYQPEESIAYLMRQILSATAQHIEQRLAHTDLTNAQWVPLFKLYTGRASTVAELARQCHLDTGAMTRTLDRLEAKNLCVRKRSSSDRRVVNIALTDIGRKVAEQLPGVISSVQNGHLKGFTHDEFNQVKAFLQRILDNAQQAHGASDAN
jgi:DNA-binding MarR family transcriptional regulator